MVEKGAGIFTQKIFLIILLRLKKVFAVESLSDRSQSIRLLDEKRILPQVLTNIPRTQTQSFRSCLSVIDKHTMSL